MPRLSPSTVSARIVNWSVNEGDEVESYQLCLRLATETLLKEDGGDDLGTHELDIEIIEDGTLARILASTDVSISVDEPIAIISDDYLSLDECRALPLDEILKDQSAFPNALWQAYTVGEFDADSCGTCG
jgi:pyruvate/2-oxoglutarate dehydrogenase complex dihydrolipoamide acyltransferase (E2) component